jgi:hypothetical protein
MHIKIDKQSKSEHTGVDIARQPNRVHLQEQPINPRPLMLNATANPKLAKPIHRQAVINLIKALLRHVPNHIPRQPAKHEKTFIIIALTQRLENPVPY